ncbi:unnamed protein product [Acanthosepion pharaonis]|uniref:Transmembrane protein n=1 Tax=Acanthosepion pharaonis TaxID=158019 RepID=A0A812D492_ACAPH|nr:unnamed protein product [Sepia pharaonis]
MCFFVPRFSLSSLSLVNNPLSAFPPTRPPSFLPRLPIIFASSSHTPRELYPGRQQKHSKSSVFNLSSDFVSLRFSLSSLLFFPPLLFFLYDSFISFFFLFIFLSHVFARSFLFFFMLFSFFLLFSSFPLSFTFVSFVISFQLASLFFSFFCLFVFVFCFFLIQITRFTLTVPSPFCFSSNLKLSEICIFSGLSLSSRGALIFFFGTSSLLIGWVDAILMPSLQARHILEIRLSHPSLSHPPPLGNSVLKLKFLFI